MSRLLVILIASVASLNACAAQSDESYAAAKEPYIEEPGDPLAAESQELACRHTPCYRNADGTVSTQGRLPDSRGHCGRQVAARTFSDIKSCMQVPYRPLPRAIFYGNWLAWGSLGQNEDKQGFPFQRIEQVRDRFGELCEEARADSGFGARLPCHADLIGRAPDGWLRQTQQVAEMLTETYGNTVSINMRPPPELSADDVLREIELIFSGESMIVDNDFLNKHPVGLSLDLERLNVDNNWRPEARVINEMCAMHRDLMTRRGHRPWELDCFLYEFALLPMVKDPENLRPYIFPVMMSITEYGPVVAKITKRGDPVTKQSITAQALFLKDEWIEEIRNRYSRSTKIGCMWAVASYLYPSQRDQFTFLQGLNYFGHKCDLYSFQ